MSTQLRGCVVDPACVGWEPPRVLLCDPCVDLETPEGRELWDAAWQVVASFLYTYTGERWPGTCFNETLRPCLDRPRCPTRCGCHYCGIYNALPLCGTCLPVIDVVSVWIGADHCNPEPRLLTPGNGVRLEWLYGEPVLVIEDADGCCGSWPKQDLCRPFMADHTWHVTLRTGVPVPPFVLQGAAELTAQIVKECIQTGCRLPGAVSNLSFDGTTVQLNPDTGVVTFPMRMIQRLLDTNDAEPPIEQFGTHSPWRMHNQTGPVRSDECCGDCGQECTTPSIDCDTCATVEPDPVPEPAPDPEPVVAAP